MNTRITRIARSIAAASVFTTTTAAMAAPQPQIDVASTAAHALAPASATVHGVVPVGGAQRITFSLEAPSTLSAATHDGQGGCPGDTTLTLLTNGALVAFDDDGGEALCSALDLDLAPGQYTLDVAGYGGAGIDDYRLDISHTAALLPGAPTPGALEAGGHERFAFDWMGGVAVMAVSDGGGGCSGDPMLAVYDAAGALRAADDDSGVDRCPQAIADLPAGRYVMVVEGYGAAPLPYYEAMVDPTAPPLGADGETGGQDCRISRLDLVYPTAHFEDAVALPVSLRGEATGPDCAQVELTLAGVGQPVQTTLELGAAVAFATDFELLVDEGAAGDALALEASVRVLDGGGALMEARALDGVVPVYTRAAQAVIETRVEAALELDGSTDVTASASLLEGAAIDGALVCVQPCGVDERTTRLDVSRVPSQHLTADAGISASLAMPACGHPTFVTCGVVAERDGVPPQGSLAGFALTAVPGALVVADDVLAGQIGATAAATPFAEFDALLDALRDDLDGAQDVDTVIEGIEGMDELGLDGVSVSTRDGSMAVMIRGQKGSDMLGFGDGGQGEIPGGEPSTDGFGGLQDGGEGLPDVPGGGIDGPGTSTLAGLVEEGLPGLPGAGPSALPRDPHTARRRAATLGALFNGMATPGPVGPLGASAAGVGSTSYVVNGAKTVGSMVGQGSTSAVVGLLRFTWSTLKRLGNAATGNSAANLSEAERQEVQRKADAYDPNRDDSNVDYCGKHFSNTTQRSACMQNTTMSNKTYKKTCIDDGVQDASFCKKNKKDYCDQAAHKTSDTCKAEDSSGSDGSLACPPGDPGCGQTVDRELLRSSMHHRMCTHPAGRPAGGEARCPTMRSMDIGRFMQTVVRRSCMASDCGSQSTASTRVQIAREAGCADARCTDPDPEAAF